MGLFGRKNREELQPPVVTPTADAGDLAGHTLLPEPNIRHRHLIERYVRNEVIAVPCNPGSKKGGEEYVIIPVGQSASDEVLTLKYFVPSEKKGKSLLKGTLRIAKDGSATSDDLSREDIRKIFDALGDSKNYPPSISIEV